jgi:hypothetical protein
LAADRSDPSPTTQGWSRQRGILAAVVAIAVVVLTLVLSRLDLASELSVVRSQLVAANQELAENQREIDELEDAARGREEAVVACRDAAELGEHLRSALRVLQRGLDRGDQGLLARGVANALQLDEQWSEANDQCLRATQDEGQG